ncbi:unnamed protein product [Rhizophagus irregularis]|nr:unnamed protein product [Rhizophagus irregularis]CAB5357759.1 unnamed protein product [Rhizophagus irregularis]
MMLKLKKCEWAKKNVEYLGHIVGTARDWLRTEGVNIDNWRGGDNNTSLDRRIVSKYASDEIKERWQDELENIKQERVFLLYEQINNKKALEDFKEDFEEINKEVVEKRKEIQEQDKIEEINEKEAVDNGKGEEIEIERNEENQETKEMEEMQENKFKEIEDNKERINDNDDLKIGDNEERNEDNANRIVIGKIEIFNDEIGGRVNGERRISV